MLRLSKREERAHQERPEAKVRFSTSLQKQTPLITFSRRGESQDEEETIDEYYLVLCLTRISYIPYTLRCRCSTLIKAYTDNVGAALLSMDIELEWLSSMFIIVRHRSMVSVKSKTSCPVFASRNYSPAATTTTYALRMLNSKSFGERGIQGDVKDLATLIIRVCSALYLLAVNFHRLWCRTDTQEPNTRYLHSESVSKLAGYREETLLITEVHGSRSCWRD